MKILITGAKGFVGKNMVAALESIRNGKDRSHRINDLASSTEFQIFEYDLDTKPEELERFCISSSRSKSPGKF